MIFSLLLGATKPSKKLTKNPTVVAVGTVGMVCSMGMVCSVGVVATFEPNIFSVFAHVRPSAAPVARYLLCLSTCAPSDSDPWWPGSGHCPHFWSNFQHFGVGAHGVSRSKFRGSLMSLMFVLFCFGIGVRPPLPSLNALFSKSRFPAFARIAGA